ncbi:MAG: CAP domain-containing protein, partial [Halobacteria archaeon]
MNRNTVAVVLVAFLIGVVAGGFALGETGGGNTTEGDVNTTTDNLTDGTRDVAVATRSPEDQPYEYRLNESASPDVSDLNTSLVERLVVERANEVRANASLGHVSYSSRLSRAARNHSANMSDSFYLGHVEPDGSSVESRYLDECAGLRDGREEFRYSENVASVWYKTVYRSPANRSVLLVTEEGVADALVDEWTNSTTHRRNLLGEPWNTTGVGVVVDENGT